LGTVSAAREVGAIPADANANESRPAPWNAARVALVAFVAVEVAALPLLLFWGRRGWFTQDDWDFLSARSVGSADDLFRPHFQHWVTLPILPYRLLWTVAGIRSYVPYQAMIVVLHLTAAALLYAVMRRAGVRPWIATIAAGAFVFFGSGSENIFVAFQITFVGALVFGLVQLLLADHDGPLEGRDWIGLLAGLAALMCSGVGITMVVVVGAAVLLRRGLAGWRAALFHTAPLAGAYLLWLWLAPEGQPAGNYHAQNVSQVWRFVVIGFEAAFARQGQIRFLGFLLGAVLVVGLAFALRGRGSWFPLGRLASSLALLGGSLLFLVLTGILRAGQGGLLFLLDTSGPERARDSRYVYLIAAMALPALALGADALIGRWRHLAIPVGIVLLLGVPGNIHRLMNPGDLFANARLTRREIVALPRLPLAEQVRGSRRLVTIQNPRFAQEGLTYGWLVAGAESGRIPDPGPINPLVVSTWTLLNFLVPTHAPRAVELDCAPAPASSVRVLEKGDELTVKRGKVNLTYVPPRGAPSLRTPPVQRSTLVALAGPLRVRIVPASGGALLCS
jgi:hypothetical protein